MNDLHYESMSKLEKPSRPWSDREKKLAPIYDKAIALRDQGDLMAASALCVEALGQLAAEDLTLRAAFHAELGFIHHLQGEHVAAEANYRMSVEARPRSHLASLGLYQSLVEQQKWDEALGEIIRFARLRYSADYQEVLRTAFKHDVDARLHALADQARALLEEQLRKN